ncbi:MAG: hypothetical protein U1F68_07760 [Gammaproteobacteria bacterium]
MTPKQTLRLASPALLLLADIATAADTPSGDFPTLARVEYVFECMTKHGGENYDNLYSCVCAIDYIRARFSYEEYSEAVTYQKMRESGGERGAIFRDPPRAGELRQKLADIGKQAESQCYLKTPQSNQ